MIYCLVFCNFSLLVQVLTRFLASSTPVPFWISAHLLLLNEPLLHRRKTSVPNVQLRAHDTSRNGCTNPLHNPVSALLPHWRTCSATTQCILGYFLSYWVLGLALHCNFLPWT